MTGLSLHLKVYPVFKPNEYFIENWCKKESDDRANDWKVYLRVVREEIIAKSFNFALSEVTMEDKFAFKDKLKDKTVKRE